MSRGLKSYANKRDRNEAELVELMRKMGVTVDQHDQPWDLCCTICGDLWRWAEVKAPKNLRGDPEKFTDRQINTLKNWPGGSIDVLVTTKDARAFADRLKSDARALRKGRVA